MTSSCGGSRAWWIATSTSAGRPHPAYGTRRRLSERIAGCRSRIAGLDNSFVAVSTWDTRRPLVPELALIVATAAYGSTFVLVQDALERVTPTGFNLLRFSVAAIVLLPFAVARGW